MEIRNFPRQDLLEFTRELRQAHPDLRERSSLDEVLFSRTPGSTLGEMQEHAAMEAVRQQNRANLLGWSTGGLVLGAWVGFIGLASSHPGAAVAVGLALGAGAGVAALQRRKANRLVGESVQARARLGTYGSVLARRLEAEIEVKNLARGLTPEQSLTIQQDDCSLVVGGVRVKRHSGKSESCSR